VRVVTEKPFGTDLESARELNDTVHEVFREEQIFRIDHFLGKEAALNLLTLRFANGFLEPLWNREHIDHVQIDVPETLSIGSRGEFYEGTGAFRDMVVTHLLQILAVVAMEPPPSLDPRALVDEGSTRAIGTSRAWPRTPTWRPSSPHGCTSTTGAGPAFPSSCGPASAWPRARA
jgi:glucose-6-phosphate 1-dehydrogenase